MSSLSFSPSDSLIVLSSFPSSSHLRLFGDSFISSPSLLSRVSSLCHSLGRCLLSSLPFLLGIPLSSCENSLKILSDRREIRLFNGEFFTVKFIENFFEFGVSQIQSKEKVKIEEFSAEHSLPPLFVLQLFEEKIHRNDGISIGISADKKSLIFLGENQWGDDKAISMGKITALNTQKMLTKHKIQTDGWVDINILSPFTPSERSEILRDAEGDEITDGEGMTLRNLYVGKKMSKMFFSSISSCISKGDFLNVSPLLPPSACPDDFEIAVQIAAKNSLSSAMKKSKETKNKKSKEIPSLQNTFNAIGYPAEWIISSQFVGKFVSSASTALSELAIRKATEGDAVKTANKKKPPPSASATLSESEALNFLQSSDKLNSLEIHPPLLPLLVRHTLEQLKDNFNKILQEHVKQQENDNDEDIISDPSMSSDDLSHRVPIFSLCRVRLHSSFSSLCVFHSGIRKVLEKSAPLSEALSSHLLKTLCSHFIDSLIKVTAFHHGIIQFDSTQWDTKTQNDDQKSAIPYDEFVDFLIFPFDSPEERCAVLQKIPEKSQREIKKLLSEGMEIEGIPMNPPHLHRNPSSNSSLPSSPLFSAIDGFLRHGPIIVSLILPFKLKSPDKKSLRKLAVSMSVDFSSALLNPSPPPSVVILQMASLVAFQRVTREILHLPQKCTVDTLNTLLSLCDVSSSPSLFVLSLLSFSLALKIRLRAIQSAPSARMSAPLSEQSEETMSIALKFLEEMGNSEDTSSLSLPQFSSALNALRAEFRSVQWDFQSQCKGIWTTVKGNAEGEGTSLKERAVRWDAFIADKQREILTLTKQMTQEREENEREGNANGDAEEQGECEGELDEKKNAQGD